MLVCPSTCFIDDQTELKSICRKFSGTKKSLSFLKKNLNVREYAKFLNCFDKMEKVRWNRDERDDSEILIHFNHDQSSDDARRLKTIDDESIPSESEDSVLLAPSTKSFCGSISEDSIDGNVSDQDDATLGSNKYAESSFSSFIMSSNSSDFGNDCEASDEIQELSGSSKFSVKDSLTLIRRFKTRGDQISVDGNEIESSGSISIDEDNGAVVKFKKNSKKETRRFTLTFSQKIVLASMVLLLTLKLVAFRLSP